MFYLYNKTYFCYDVGSKKKKFNSKGLCKRVLEQSGDGRSGMDLQVVEEKDNLTSKTEVFTQTITLLQGMYK